MAGRPPEDLDTSTWQGRVGARLRELRLRAGLSTQEAAESVGRTVAAWNAWERGTRNLPVELLPEIAETLGVRVRTVLPNE